MTREDAISRTETINHLSKRLYESALNNMGYECDADDVFIDIADNRLETWINELPTVHTKQKRGYNCNAIYRDCDQFVCSECGIELQDWNGIERNNDGDISYYEYVFKYCPNCGAKM